jgi:hypothetical protein
MDVPPPWGVVLEPVARQAREALRMGDGPDEVHREAIARLEIQQDTGAVR